MASQILGWGGVVVPFVGIQAAINLLNVVAGWLLVRLLPSHEFALFTSAFAAFTILNVIANGGVASAMISQGALAIDNPREMRGLINVVHSWRVRLAALAATIAMPILAYSMHRLDYSATAVAAGLVLGLAYVALNILEQPWTTVLRLQGQYKRLQRIELQNAAARLVAVACLVYVYHSGLVALSITVAIEALLLVQVRNACAIYVAPGPGVIDFRRPVAAIIREALPGVAFFAVQGQVSVGTTMLLGSQLAVASVGALGRVNAVFALLGPLIDNVVAPRFARLGGTRLSAAYGQLLFVAILATVTLTALIVWFTEPLLGLLGPAYQGLTIELWLVTATAGLGFVGTMIGSLNKARSWLRRSWILGPATLAALVCALFTLPVDTARGSLALGFILVFPNLLVGIYQALAGLGEAKKPHSVPDGL